MYHCENAVKNPVLSPIYWTTFIIIAAMIMMSLFVGAITMAMTESMDKMKKEKAEEAEEEMATLKEKQNGDRKVQGSEKRNSEKAPTFPESAMSYQELRKISTKRRMCELLNIHWSGSRGSRDKSPRRSQSRAKKYPSTIRGKSPSGKKDCKPCRNFLKGKCNRGDACDFWRTISARFSSRPFLFSWRPRKVWNSADSM
mgnify:CR=1 FL=1